MIQITIQFDPDLEIFLSKKDRPGPVTMLLDRRASIKDIIESKGVPHTEIGEMFFNGYRVDFNFFPGCNGLIQVFSVQQPFDVRAPSYLRPVPLGQIKFVADINVIRLGRLMILLGFDVLYASHLDDQDIANIAEQQQRIVLTRDIQMLKRNQIVYARWVRENQSYDQLVEIVQFFGLQKQVRLFSRCVLCNLAIAEVEKGTVVHRLEPKTKKYFHSFKQCPGCGKVYWKGSHYDHLKAILPSFNLILED